ncbi:MAG: phosphatase PAP2 family protein [Acidimicrobiia bacterium]|nr:phosphatase PAP2 family protein [Acidimicrobiia bacterium]MDH5290534.1 phosphatase PAP2 family protein [Acidimicrobiia bacterium]
MILVLLSFGAYLGVRAAVNESATTAMANARHLLNLEHALGLGGLEQRIQMMVLGHPSLVELFNTIYVWSYWPTVFGVLIFTWARRRHLYHAYRNAIMLSGGIGLVIFALFPAAPPRFLDGFVDTVDLSRGSLIGHPSFLINKFAALPSFHVGWVALACTVLALGARRRWVRPLMVAPPLVMTAAVVITGNHFIVDAVTGTAISLLALLVTHWQAVRRGTLNPPPPTGLAAPDEVRADEWEATAVVQVG